MSGINIGLGNNDTEIRKDADSDFITFWEKQAKISLGFQLGKKHSTGVLLLLGGLSVVRLMPHTIH